MIQVNFMEQLKEESMQYEAGEIHMRPLLEFLERASRVPKGKNACIVEAFRELEAVRELCDSYEDCHHIRTIYCTSGASHILANTKLDFGSRSSEI